MNRTWLPVALCVFLVTVPVASAPVRGAGHPVEVIVGYEGTANETAITAAGGTVTGGRSIELSPVRFARVPERALPAIESHPAVAYVERDRRMLEPAQTTPWGIERVGASAATTVTDANQSAVQVAVVDTGIDYDHEDLAPNVEWGVDTVGSGSIERGAVAADDDNGHGTHVAGAVAARDNADGVVGVAPAVQLYGIKAIGASGRGTGSDFIQGVESAVAGPDGTVGTADDADVISMSLSTDTDARAIEDAVEAAADHAVLVAAAGNGGDGDPTTDEVQYPAAYEPVVAVAATDRDDRVPPWSSSGAAVEIAAPGVDILSTYPDDQYAVTSGTSMATPFVAGTAALLIARDLGDGTRTLSDEAVRTRLVATAQDIEAQGVDSLSGAEGASVNVSIARRTVPLALAANATDVTVGDRIAFTVTRGDTGEPVAATVAVGNDTLQTGTDGRATYGFDRTGTVTATATKPETATEQFDPSSVSVSVARRTVPLALETSAPDAVVGENVTFTVTRGDTGEPVASTVTVNGTVGLTDDDGQLRYRFGGPGTFSVTANKTRTATERFVPAVLSISVSERRRAVYREGTTAASYDRDGDGRISVSELGRGATDFANGTLTIGQLGNIATAYANS